MTYSLNSLILAGYCLVLVAASFPVTQLIYKEIAGIHVYQSLNLLCLFFVLGISLENIIIFCEAWRWSRVAPYLKLSQKRRMAFTYRQTTRNIFTTTAVTTAACFSLVFTEVIPIRTFGFYAAILIFVSFLVVITLLPPMLVFYESKIEPCLCSLQLIEKVNLKIRGLTEHILTKIYNSPQTLQPGTSILSQLASRLLVDVYFSVIYFLRWPILVIMLALSGCAAYYASRIESQEYKQSLLGVDNSYNVYS